MSINFNGNTTISRTTSKDVEFYYGAGWGSDSWRQAVDSPPRLVKGYSGTPPLTPNFNGLTHKSRHDYLYRSTWVGVGFDMERYWYISENVDIPRLIKRVNTDLGVPGTHQMRYQHVEPSIDGTMNYMGVTWKSRGSFYRFPDPAIPGVIGETVEYEVGNLEHTIFDDEQNKNIEVFFLASGIRDIDGAGGFSQYNDELKRSVTITEDASAQVNFYFAEEKYFPTFSFKISISTPEGVIDIIGKGQSSAYPIRMQYNDMMLGLPTVDLMDARASNLHVSTDDGIKAFQTYSTYSVDYEGGM